MDWNPDAKRVVYSDAGDYLPATGRKIVWHTTETRGLPTYSGTQPHFTLNPRTGELWQHQPLSKAAKALKHPLGTVETNRAHAYQVELICYSDEAVARRVGGLVVSDLTRADYRRIAKLARWIEKNAAVPRKRSVTFKHYPESAGVGNGVRLTEQEWLVYEGHLGHQHVPGNDHGDPSDLRVGLILAKRKWQAVKDGKVFVRGTLRRVTRWIRKHPRLVRRTGGVNVRRR